jgi:hypothetical protein
MTAHWLQAASTGAGAIIAWINYYRVRRTRTRLIVAIVLSLGSAMFAVWAIVA